MSALSSIAVPASQWPARTSVSACQSCGKTFGVFSQRDHCQCCGRVCCASTCLDNRVAVPGQSSGSPVPVCDLCASAIRRVWQDAEVAIERCHILEQLLNEQTLQSEKLMGQSKALRVENEYLLKEKDRLATQLKKTEIELEVAAAKAALKDSPSPSASPAASPNTSSAPGGARGGDKGRAAAESDAASAEAASAWEKKKRQLDMREATLQEALKKVSADAAKLVSQRTALQERERQFKETLTKQFEHVFSEERAQWEALYTRQTNDIVSQFRDWLNVAQQQQSHRPHDESHTLAPLTREPMHTPRLTEAEADARIHAAVEEAEARLREEHALAVADLEHELQDYRQELAALNDKLVSAARVNTDSIEAAVREAAEAVRRDMAVQLTTERRRWEDDRLILENTVEALRRSLQEAKNAYATQPQQGEEVTAALAEAEVLRERIADLQRANNELAESSEQKLRRMRDQVTEVHRVTSREVSQLEAALAQERTRSESAQAALKAAHEAELNTLRETLAAAKADTEADVEQEERAKEAAEVLKMWKDECAKQKGALETLRAEYAAERAALLRTHEAALASVTAAADDLREQLKTQGTTASIAATAAEARTQQRIAELEAAHAAAIAEASLSPPALRELSNVFLEDTRLAQRVMLTEHAQSLLTAKESLTAMASRSLKARQEEQATAAAGEQKLKRLLASAKRQSKEYEARAEEHAREALQNKRETIAAKEELAQIKEKLRRQQQQQRNHNATASAISPNNALNTPASSGPLAVVRGEHDGLSSFAELDVFLAAATSWIGSRQQLLATYVEAMQRGPLSDVTGLFGLRFAVLADEVERRREQSRRNALALERTTSTIKDLQQDLRLRTERVDSREAALAEAELRLKAKRDRILVLCRSLSTVTQKLRERQVALSQEETDAEAAAVQEVQELDTSPSAK